MPDNPYKTDVSKLAGLIWPSQTGADYFAKHVLISEPVKAVYELTKT